MTEEVERSAKRVTTPWDSYMSHLSELRFDNFVDLPSGVQNQILSYLTPAQILNLHSIAGQGGVNINLANRRRDIINGYIEQVIRNDIGPEGFTQIVEYIPSRNTSYMRHIFIAYITSSIATRMGIQARLHFGDEIVELYNTSGDQISLTFDVSWDSSELRLMGRLLKDFVTEFRHLIGNNKKGEFFVRSDGLPLKYYTTLGEPQNRVLLITFLLYLIHNKGCRIVYDKLVSDRLEEPQPVRSCISCNIQKAKFTCKCHMKEYCGQECANKDHD